jgi:alkylhydroperoxidase family enzyme
MTVIAWTLESEVDAATETSGDRSVWDYVPRVTKTFLLQPEGYRAWKAARDETVPKAADRRWNRLATVAAAAAVRALRRTPNNRGRLSSVERWTLDPDVISLNPADLAVVLFAAKVAAHTDNITENDLATLRAHGLADEQIFDIALAAAASCFFADAADNAAS